MAVLVNLKQIGFVYRSLIKISTISVMGLIAALLLVTHVYVDHYNICNIIDR